MRASLSLWTTLISLLELILHSASTELPGLPKKCRHMQLDLYITECGCREWSQKEGRAAWRMAASGEWKEDCEHGYWQRSEVSRKLKVRSKHYWKIYFDQNIEKLRERLGGDKPLENVPDRKRKYLLFSEVEDKIGMSFKSYRDYYEEQVGNDTCVYIQSSTDSENSVQNLGNRKLKQYLYQCKNADFCCDFNTQDCCYEERTVNKKLGPGGIAGVVMAALFGGFLVIALVGHLATHCRK